MNGPDFVDRKVKMGNLQPNRVSNFKEDLK